MESRWTLSTIHVSRRVPDAAVRDVKCLHGVVLVAALSGEEPRPVLWARPEPRLLIVRHDRPITATDMPEHWVDGITHSPYWLPDTAGQAVSLAFIVERGQTGQSRGGYEKENAWRVANGKQPRGTVSGTGRQRHRIRTVERMLELCTERLTPLLAELTMHHVKAWHQPGERTLETGGLMHANPLMIRASGTVIDITGLRKIMEDGIGRHRSFGCGLILARPAC
jgi:hypothetical protein